MSTRQVVLCHPVRTAIGTYGGSLKDMPAPELGAAAIRETLKRSGLAADRIQTLVMGNVIQRAFVSQPAHWRVMADLALLALFAGLYSVPMYALIQRVGELLDVPLVPGTQPVTA
jgi:acetyl-CoA acetyltransferase